jgi:outer membrane usher protein FimD/PapC
VAHIMTPVVRLACVVAACGLAARAHAADVISEGAYVPVPAAYSLSYDKDRWSDEFSVFRMAVTDTYGVIGSSFAASDDPRLHPLTRLDSSWKLTAPLLGLPMQLGDGVSSAGLWDQPARLGGLQIGTLQLAPPEVVAPPASIALPYSVSGPASTATSPFIDHLRSMVQFQKQTLAPAGQGDFSVESGRLRENFEMRSADYGPWITSGTYRYGLNAATTVDGEVAQVAGQQSFVGLGVMEGLGPLGMVSAKLASSRDPQLNGWLARMGYDFNLDRLSIAVRSHIQSPGFQDVGDASLLESFKQRTLASARLDLGTMGKISLASASETYTDDTRRDILAVSHAMPFGGGGVVSTAAAYSPGQFGSATLLLSFTYPFNYLTGAPRKVDAAVSSALDRTIVDAFGQTRLPTPGRLPTDRPTPD